MPPGYFATPYLPATQPMDAMRRMAAEKHKEQGNQYRQLQMIPQAIAEYQTALRNDPTYTDAHYNLGRTYMVAGNTPMAATAFRALLSVDPNDHEARTLLAEQLIKLGDKPAAMAEYQAILQRVPNYDSASRALQYLQMEERSRGQRPMAFEIKLIAKGRDTTKAAKEILKAYYTQTGQTQMIGLIDQLDYRFEETQAVNRMTNLAEYDPYKRAIRFKPEMAFAAPVVLAAYMAHELIHAVDGDGLSSVLEEQNGYRALAQFWQANHGQVIEPNLDLALKLYRESSAKLDHKVRELYTMRNPMIPEKSPGHGMPYAAQPAQLQQYQYQAQLEANAKYSRLVYEQMKSQLPMQ